MIRALRVGVPGGFIAGTIMAVWSMAAMWLVGSGFWTPMNLVAHTFYRAAPLNGTFSVRALLVGLAVHFTVSSAFGTLLAAIALRRPGSRSLVVAGGFLFVAVVWPVMHWVVWYKLDEAAAEGFNEWIFAVAHLFFGIAAAGMASLVVADAENPHRLFGATQGRHAAGSIPQQRDPAPGSLFQPTRRQ
jgi:hypothetical protein